MVEFVVATRGSLSPGAFSSDEMAARLMLQGGGCMNDFIVEPVGVLSRCARGASVRKPQTAAVHGVAGGARTDASAVAAEGSAAVNTGKGSAPRDALALFGSLLPFAFGLAFARAGLVVAAYDSYRSTDVGVLTDVSTLISLVPLFVLFLVCASRRSFLSKTSVWIIMHVCVALEILTIIGVAIVKTLPGDNTAAFLALWACAGAAEAGLVFYWLRRARGSSPTVAAVLVFLALILSEIELLICVFLPDALSFGIAVILVLAQYPCVVWSRAKTQPRHIDTNASDGRDFFGNVRKTILNGRFLLASAIGMGLLSVVIGFLRSYPDGQEFFFSLPARISYALIVVAVSVGVIALVLSGRHRVVFLGMFAVMSLFACVSIVLYSAFPDQPQYGAIFATVLNALMVIFIYYVTIAFMTCGWRDPYYYATAGRLIWLGCRAVSRIVLPGLLSLLANDALAHALAGLLLIVSTQAVFITMLTITSEDEQTHAELEPESRIAKIMAIGKAQDPDESLGEQASLTDIRQEAMSRSAEKMGAQFLLSEREIEVLTLYAQGFTQKSVGEKLFISQGTVHAHIKRIYAKTGLHSRQDLLNYLERYAS